MDNARIIQAVLEGERGARRDNVVLNAALAIQVARDGTTLPDAVAAAHESIASGRALQVLKDLRTATHA